MELISMLIKEFEFTFLILQFGAVLESLHWIVEDPAIEYLKTRSCMVPTTIGLGFVVHIPSAE